MITKILTILAGFMAGRPVADARNTLLYPDLYALGVVVRQVSGQLWKLVVAVYRMFVKPLK